MNNLEAAFAILESHRKGGQWTPEVVAADLLTQLGLDPKGEAKKANPALDPNKMTLDQVTADETAAQVAADKAKVSREALEAQEKALAEAEAAKAKGVAETEAAQAAAAKQPVGAKLPTAANKGEPLPPPPAVGPVTSVAETGPGPAPEQKK
jgi:hypothetical protein